MSLKTQLTVLRHIECDHCPKTWNYLSEKDHDELVASAEEYGWAKVYAKARE